jgi:excisionase family DNA binding protein
MQTAPEVVTSSPGPTISLANAALHHDTSIWTLRRLIANGTLPAYKLGGRIRIKIADLDALLVKMT